MLFSEDCWANSRYAGDLRLHGVICRRGCRFSAKWIIKAIFTFGNNKCIKYIIWEYIIYRPLNTTNDMQNWFAPDTICHLIVSSCIIPGKSSTLHQATDECWRICCCDMQCVCLEWFDRSNLRSYRVAGISCRGRHSWQSATWFYSFMNASHGAICCAAGGLCIVCIDTAICTECQTCWKIMLVLQL